ncbi:MAG: hypothetical protein ACRDX9_06350 [Acidimicrobiia bacterium]
MRFRPAVFVFLLMSIGCSGDTAVTSDQEVLELSDLSGVWANDTVVLRINDAGDFLVQPADAAGEVVMRGFIARDDRRFIFVTGVGGECPGTRGAYTATVDPDALALTLDDDPCDLRAGWFGKPLSAVTE